jgi:site-specific recombinase XerD
MNINNPIVPSPKKMSKQNQGGQPTKAENTEEFSQFLQLKGYKASTIKNTIKVIKEYQTFVRSQPKENYLNYLKQRQNKNHPNQKLSLQTINSQIYCLKLYDKYLHFKNEPGLKLNFLLNKLKPKKIETLTIEEIKQLFKATESRPKWAKRDKSVLVCLYHLGLRAGETANLKTEEINFEENWLLIANSKTGYQRQVPINPTAKAILEEYANEINPENPFFIQGLKGKLQADSLLQIIKKLTQTAQIQKRVYAHLLRHSIATHLMHNGLDITQVSKFLGHRRLDSTERYTHLIEF